VIGLRAGMAALLHAGLAAGCGVDDLGTGSKILIALRGQSNAQPHDLASNLSAANTTYGTTYSNVSMIQKQAPSFGNDPPLWEDFAQQSLGPVTFGGGAGKIGLEASLMRDLDRARPGGFAFVGMAIGGSSSIQWKSTSVYPTTPPYLPALDVAQIKAAMASMGCTSVIYVWDQGEGDAQAQAFADAYAAFMTDHMAQVRAALGNIGPNGTVVPIVFGKLNADADILNYVYKANLRASQVTYAGSDARSSIVDRDSITFAGGMYDKTHYNANGYVEVGHLTAPAVAAYAGVKIPPVASFTSSAAQLIVTFTDTSTHYGGALSAWAWDFGDGTTSTSQNPSKTYGASGTYNVSVRVTDVAGSMNTSSVVAVSVVSGITGVTRDALSTWYVPATSAEWVTFLADSAGTVGAIAKSPPTSLYLMQEASGNLTDTIGAITLTAANTPAYQQSITGATRKGVLCADGTAKAFSSASASLPDISVTSMMSVAIVQTPAAAPAVNRNLIAMGVGANRSHIGIEATTGKARATSGVNTATAAASVCDAALHIVANRVNRGALEDDAYVDAGVTMTPTAAAGMTGKTLEIGAQSGGLSAAAAIYGYMAVFSAEDWSDADVVRLVNKMKGL
jgi:PKD repeat protein